MPGKSHIILGLSEDTPEMIKQLQKRGASDIYVMDYNQSSVVKEENGIFYVSPDGASIVANRSKNITYHRYVYIKRHEDID